jgi:DNA-binding beta-propeller fold protein YncE
MKVKMMTELFLLLLLMIGLCIQSFAQSEYEMLVSSRNTNSVKKFNGLTGDYVDDFVYTGSGGLSITQDIKIGPEGNILVSGRGNTGVLMYERVSGDFIKQFTSGYSLDNPTKISFGPDGKLYVSQWGTIKNKVVRFNGITGVFIDEFTPSLNLALGHTWDNDGNLYVACYGSKDVRKFDTSGNFLRVFTEAGHLQGPTNLWFGKNGSLFVEDWVLGSVIEFDATDGTYIKNFITGLQNAEGFAFGPDSNLYLCDWSQNQIRRYSPDGSFIDVFTNQGNMQAPNSILFRPVQTTNVENETGSLLDDFKLYQNYPNPFNPTTEIKFSLPYVIAGETIQSQPVALTVYNVLGKEIATLLNEELIAGEYEVEFDATGLQSGVYFYQLKANDYIDTRKMILMK